MDRLRSHSPPLARPFVTFAIGALFWAIGFGWMFRQWWTSGFDLIFGGTGDPQVYFAILEHWHRVFTGAAVWKSPNYFHPVPGALGFTDSLFLYGVPYAAFRAAGVSAPTSLMLVMALLSVIGFAGVMHLARRHLKASATSAALGAFLFTFANMAAIKIWHQQIYCAMVFPVVVDLAVTAAKSGSSRRAAAFAAAAGLLHALALLSSFVVGWFFTAFALLVAAVYLVLAGTSGALELLRHVVRDKRPMLIGYGAGFAVGLIPFFIIYGPVMLAGAVRDHRVHRALQPYIFDIINVGRDNLVWGQLQSLLGFTNRPYDILGEVALGYSPGVFAIWFTFAALLARNRWRAQLMDTENRLLLAIAIALVVAWLVQLSWFGLHPWRVVWSLVPGAKVVRTTVRSQIVLNLAASCLVIVAFDRLRTWLAERRRSAIVLPLIAAVLVVEQFNTKEPRVVSRSLYEGWLKQVPPPPSSCAAFYVTINTVPPDWDNAHANAMLMSQVFGVPTISGIGSFFPPHWDLLNFLSPGYLAGVRKWIEVHNLSKGICGFEPGNGRWTMGPPP